VVWCKGLVATGGRMSVSIGSSGQEVAVTVESCCSYVFCYYHIFSYSLDSIFLSIYGCIPV
jgi:hypothetical protein